MPVTTAGRAAATAALVGVAALVVANLVLRDATGARDVLRVVAGVVFIASGIASLVLSVRALLQSERSVVVWSALVFGLLVAILMLAEFTVME